MKSEMQESITKINELMNDEINSIKEKYCKQIDKIRKQCNHVDDDGVDALMPAGYPFHSGWDICLICGSYIETNEYGRG